MKNKLITLSLLPFAVVSLVSCKHADDDIASTSSKTIKVYYTDVVLDWDHNTFTHGDFRVSIPEKWGAGVLGQRSKFVEYDPHDIVFSYDLITSKTYGGDTLYKAEFKELEKENPKKVDKLFEISVVGIDIDSKLLVKDELVDDCYFKYDTNEDFYNYCYFKMAKNDIKQLKDGYYNQINVRLDYYIHIDKCLSFVVSEKDGLNTVGAYSEVSISHNPDLIS